MLDAQALLSMADWHFVPGQVDGKVTCMWGSVSVKFVLTD